MTDEAKHFPAKMYILVPDTVTPGYAALGAAHASVACFAKFAHLDEVKDWLDVSFRKVVCKVSVDEFEAAKKLCPDHVLITEDSIGDAEIALAFRPRSIWPPEFRKYQLFT